MQRLCRAHLRSLTTKIDKWNCMHIRLDQGEQVAQEQLAAIVAEAKAKNLKAAWLNSQGSPEVVAPAFATGFKFHIAHEDQFVMYQWLLSDQDSTLPPPISHQLGVSSVCLNSKGQLLMVKDKGTLKFYGDYWKLPGGRVDLHENIADASVREIFEECGLNCNFKSILGFRETLSHPNVPMGRGDIFYITRVELKDLGEDSITMCERELYDAQWVNIDEISSSKDSKYNVSAIGEAILSVVRDGLDKGWDDVDITLKKYEWTQDENITNKGIQKILKNRSFTFYRR